MWSVAPAAEVRGRNGGAGGRAGECRSPHSQDLAHPSLRDAEVDAVDLLEGLSQLTLPRRDLRFPPAPSPFSIRHQTGTMEGETVPPLPPDSRPSGVRF